MKYLLFIIITFFEIGGLVLFCNYLKKLNFDLKGKELILYQLCFFLLFHIGKYKGIYFYQECISLYLLLIIAIYYLLKSIKTYKYIDISIFSIYIMLFIFNGISIKYIPFPVNTALEVSNLFILFVGGTLIYLLMINLITFFISRKKEIQTTQEYFVLKNKLVVLIVLIIGILSVVYGILGTKICNRKAQNLALDALNKKYGHSQYELQHSECSNILCEFKFWDKKNEELFEVNIDKIYFKEEIENFKCLTKASCNKKASKVAVEYLRNKYGTDSYTLNEKLTVCYYNLCEYYFDSMYVKKPFYVKVNTETIKVINDNFLLRYFENIGGVEIKNEYELGEYLTEELEKSLKKEIYDTYELEIELASSIDYSKFSSITFKKLPSIEDFKTITSLRITKVKIMKIFTAEDKEKFFKYIINIYENLYVKNIKNNYSQSMSFDFAYTNPFYESNKAYKDGGYIKDTGNSYLIYVKPQPYSIEK